MLQRDLSLVNFGFQVAFFNLQFSIFWGRTFSMEENNRKFRWHCISDWSLNQSQADIPILNNLNLSFFLSILSRSNFDHHLRCGGWLNFEFSKREKHSGWAIKTIYKKLCRGMLNTYLCTNNLNMSLKLLNGLACFIFLIFKCKKKKDRYPNGLVNY